jgi:predicted dehydrogenase
MIDRGELGEIYYICAQRANLGQIRRNENAMWSLAPHDISVVQYLLGADPVSVSATGRAFVQTDEQIHDVTHLTLHFAGKQFASITSSWLDPEKVRLIKVVGSKKMVVFDDMDPRYKLQVHEKSVDWDQFLEPAPGSSLKVRSGDIAIPFVNPIEPLKAECAEFIRCIETGDKPRASGCQGYANVRILACADESLKQQGMPVATNL